MIALMLQPDPIKRQSAIALFSILQNNSSYQQKHEEQICVMVKFHGEGFFGGGLKYGFDRESNTSSSNGAGRSLTTTLSGASTNEKTKPFISVKG